MRFRVGVEHAFVVIGLVLVAGAAFAYEITVRRPRTWPQADAIVVSSRVVNPSGPDSYSPEIVFRYQAAGQSREVTIVPSWSSSVYSAVRAHVEQYPAGATVRVAVNPDDPDDLRYDLSASLVNLMLPGVLGLLGLAFGGVGAGVLVANRKTAARRPSVDDLRPGVADAGASTTVRRVAMAFGAIGLLIMGIGIWLFQRDVATLRDWPTVEANVVESHAVTVSSSSTRGRGPRTLYDVQVTFRFMVGDRTYQSATSYGIASSSQSRARDMVAKYSPGTAHVIRYRPGDPNIIRFDMDSYFAVFVMSIGMTAMGLVFLGFALLIWRTMGAGRGQSGTSRSATAREYRAGRRR